MTEEKDLKNEVVEEKNVTLPEAQFNGILARLEQLEKRKGKKTGYPTGMWKPSEEEGKVYYGTIRKYRPATSDKYAYALDWKFDREELDPNTREVKLMYRVVWLGEDDKEFTTDMSLVEFAKKAEREKVKIVEKKVQKLEKVVGETRVTKVDFSHYKATSGGKVPMKVMMDKIEYVVELPDGRKVTIGPNILNA